MTCTRKVGAGVGVKVGAAVGARVADGLAMLVRVTVVTGVTCSPAAPVDKVGKTAAGTVATGVAVAGGTGVAVGVAIGIDVAVGEGVTAGVLSEPTPGMIRFWPIRNTALTEILFSVAMTLESTW
jgi:hypothetical protein